MSLYQQMNSQQNLNLNNIQQVKQMYDQFCTMSKSKNPTDLIRNMMLSNPRMKNAMGIIQQMGGDPKTAFYNLAQQKGVDPESILSQLR